MPPPQELWRRTLGAVLAAHGNVVGTRRRARCWWRPPHPPWFRRDPTGSACVGRAGRGFSPWSCVVASPLVGWRSGRVGVDNRRPVARPGARPRVGAPECPEPPPTGTRVGRLSRVPTRPCIVGLPTLSHAGDARAHARGAGAFLGARGGGRRVVSDRLRRHPEEARGGREVRRRDERRREQRDGVRRCAEFPARRTTGRARRRGGLTHATNARTHAHRRHVRPRTRHRRRHLHVLAQRVVDEHLRLGVPRHRPGRKRPSRHPPRALRREVRAADLQV